MTISPEASREASGTASTAERGIEHTFAKLRASKTRALVPYITAGHPDLERSVELLIALQESGADVIELGLPFSDPMADGPVIQASSQMALDQGMSFDRLLEMVAKAKARVPLVLMSYLNPIMAAGSDALERAADAGIGGLLLIDLPVGSDPELESRIGSGPLSFIRLVAPTTPEARMKEIAEHGSGFVYLISSLGVTGMRDTLPPELSDTVKRLRGATTLPVCVGFGVSRPEQAAQVARIADGVVVGSAIVRAAGEGVEQAARLAAEMRAAIDGA
ncbi:MAG TPA: tryptophan synthase subunit alpha [Gemmatimonadaceae bacterium]|nr:tryptophan synthase subunit alpha [Gemmatimonadaceae bacterium]